MPPLWEDGPREKARLLLGYVERERSLDPPPLGLELALDSMLYSQTSRKFCVRLRLLDRADDHLRAPSCSSKRLKAFRRAGE